MSDSPYHQLDKLIDEYEEDARIIKSGKFIMVNYPKIYVMAVASFFERQIKQRCKDFTDFPLLVISTSYPVLNAMIQRSGSASDNAYKKFCTLDHSTGVVNLDASKFYDLFGGISFKNVVENNFTSVLSTRLTKYQGIVNNLTPLINSGEQYEREYAKNSDIKERLERCTFLSAEEAFLNLKLRRNRVAHDYISGLSDSFENIRDLYLDAVIYVIALEQTILGLTDLAALASAS